MPLKFMALTTIFLIGFACFVAGIVVSVFGHCLKCGKCKAEMERWMRIVWIDQNPEPEPAKELEPTK